MSRPTIARERSRDGSYQVTLDGEPVGTIWAYYRRGQQVPVAHGWGVLLRHKTPGAPITEAELNTHPTRRAALDALTRELDAQLGEPTA